MSGVSYTRYELRRTFRNRRFFLFSLGFPLVFYFLVAGPQRNNHNFGGTGLSVPLYYMVGLAAFGTMVSMISTGARIAGERQAGWTRQLRISPLSVRAYFRAKVLTGYGMALSSLLLLYASGAALGVRLPAGHWLEMTGLILVGLLPFAALGILIGHLVTTDSVGPVIGGEVSLLAFLGGTWFPITNRIPAHGGTVPPFVVARSRQPCRARWPGVGRPGLDHGCCLDRDPLRRRRLGLPPGHESGVAGGQGAVGALADSCSIGSGGEMRERHLYRSNGIQGDGDLPSLSGPKPPTDRSGWYLPVLVAPAGLALRRGERRAPRGSGLGDDPLTQRAAGALARGKPAGRLGSAPAGMGGDRGDARRQIAEA